MNLKSMLRVVATILLIAAFANFVQIQTGQDKSVEPSTELQKLLAEKQFESALKSSTEALRKNPQDLAAHLAKGISLTALNQRQEAISAYQKAIRDFPDATEPYNNLAVLYAAEGKHELARQTLEKALLIPGSYAVAYKNINTIYAKLADQAYNKALELGSEKPAPLPLSFLTEPGKPGKQSFVLAINQIEPANSFPPEKKPSSKPAAPVQLATAQEPLPTPAIQELSKKSEAPPSPSSPPAIATAAPPAPPPTKQIPVSVVSSEPTVAPKADKKSVQDKPAKVAESTPPAIDNKTPDRHEKEVGDTVRAWAAAWSKQDIKAYLGYYASNFDPGNQSRSAWEADRRARIGGKARISVTVSDLVISTKSATSVSVRFRQGYRSDRLNSQTTKTLMLERKGDAWRIVQERAGG